MRVCVFGAGAVGGMCAVRLAQAGHDVSVVARGEHLRAIQDRGLSLVANDDVVTADVRAAPDAAGLGIQDVVLVTLKATSLGGLVTSIAPMLGPETMIVFAQNGIPWWYGQGSPAGGAVAPDLGWMDPDGSLGAIVGNAVGGVIYSANEVVGPGVVRNISVLANSLYVGELDDRRSDRVVVLREALSGAGVASPDIDDLRAVVWRKLVMNMTGSLLAGVTGAPVIELQRNPAFAIILDRLHAEAVAIARAHSPGFEAPPPFRSRTAHKPSILQDYERKRPMEIDVLVAAPLAFARAAGVETPTLDMQAALLIERAVRAGLYVETRPLPIKA